MYILRATILPETDMMPEETLRKTLETQDLSGKPITFNFGGPKIGYVVKAWYEKRTGIVAEVKMEKCNQS